MGNIVNSLRILSDIRENFRCLDNWKVRFLSEDETKNRCQVDWDAARREVMIAPWWRESTSNEELSEYFLHELLHFVFAWVRWDPWYRTLGEKRREDMVIMDICAMIHGVHGESPFQIWKRVLRLMTYDLGVVAWWLRQWITTKVFITDKACSECARCAKCRRTVHDWSVDDITWAEVTGFVEGEGILCWDCFAEKAYSKGISVNAQMSRRRENERV